MNGNSNQNLGEKAPPTTSSIHTKNFAPSQNNLGNSGCTITQHVHVVQTESKPARLPGVITEHDGKAETKVQILSQYLKRVDVDLAKFLRPNLVYLYEHTKNLSHLIACLVASNILSQVEADSLDRLTDFEKNGKLYKIAGQVGNGEKLVQALDSSENHHILDEMHKWIKN